MNSSKKIQTPPVFMQKLFYKVILEIHHSHMCLWGMSPPFRDIFKHLTCHQSYILSIEILLFLLLFYFFAIWMRKPTKFIQNCTVAMNNVWRVLYWFIVGMDCIIIQKKYDIPMKTAEDFLKKNIFRFVVDSFYFMRQLIGLKNTFSMIYNMT